MQVWLSGIESLGSRMDYVYQIADAVCRQDVYEAIAQDG